MLSVLLASAVAAAGGSVEASFPQEPLRVDAQGRFSFPVGCDADGPSCAGDLRLYTSSQRPSTPGIQAERAATRLGVAPFTLAAGAERRVPVQLNAAGRRALARRAGGIYKVNLRVRERSAGGRFSPVIDGTIELRAAR